MGLKGDVRSGSGAPIAADFNNSTGTPLYVDTATGIAYFINPTGEVLPLAMADPIFTIATTGLWQGQTAVVYNILAKRSSWVNNTDYQDIVEFSGGTLLNYAEPSGANIEIVSTSVADDGSPAGTGAQTVKITYLDSAGLQTSASFTMNGTTAVNVGTAVYSVQWMEVTAVGSNVVSAGTITLRNVATPTIIYEQITAGGNKSMSGRFKVPSDCTAYVIGWDLNAINNDIDYRLRGTVDTTSRALSTVFHFDDNAYMAIDTGDEHSLPYLKYPANSRIKISGIPANTATTRGDGSMKIVCISD